MDVALCVLRKVVLMLVYGSEGKRLQGEEEWEMSGDPAALSCP